MEKLSLKEITKIFASRGGKATVKKHGKKHMQKIGRKGGKASRGPQYLDRDRGYKSWKDKNQK